MAETGPGNCDIIKGKPRAKWRNQAWLIAFITTINLFLASNIRHDLSGGWPWPAALPFANLTVAATFGACGWLCWRRSRVQP